MTDRWKGIIINDLTVNYYAAIEGKPGDAHYRIKFGGKRHTPDIDERDVVLSRVVHSIRTRLESTREVTVPEACDITRGLGYFQRNLASTHALVSTRGAALVLLTMPACSLTMVATRAAPSDMTSHAPLACVRRSRRRACEGLRRRPVGGKRG
jgi:hypothetical protein